MWHNEAYAPIPVSFQDVGGYFASPPGESVDGTLYPWGWDSPDFDDSQWETPAVPQFWRAEITRMRGSTLTGEGAKWQLIPRSIPQMEETLIRFDQVRRTQGIDTDGAFLRREGDLVIRARTKATLLLDQAHLTNAYTVVQLSGGAGSQVTMTFAEALLDAEGQKGNRNEIEGKSIRGIRDVIRPDGGENRQYHSLWFRTYRYVQLDIETANQSLRIHDLHGIFTGYPFELKAKFSSNLDWLKDVWEIDWRVARLCAWETYFDTPYYEQLQYIGDTRIQGLVTLYMSDDDRLVRQAISHFDWSRMPEGITASRYPSDLPQYIPTFSLIWIAMVHDYWMHRDDEAYVRSMLPGIRGVIGWYERRMDATGLVGPIPWWPFVDWADGWNMGKPPGASDGHSIMVNLQLVYALQRAAELEDHFGLKEEGRRFRVLADVI
ncbi:MAG: alpha-L-rhamnosidase, partial [Verrucomicrobiae bacterium]|nr:alpha-L-rhamnosidase [Verrucomicrobiae bacterium]